MITREMFAKVCREAFDDTVKLSTIVSDSGIYPVNSLPVRPGPSTMGIHSGDHAWS